MKKLLSAIAIAASTTAFAEYVFNYDVVTTNDFEAAVLGEGTGGFAVEASTAEGATHDATTVAAYESDADKPQQTPPAASEYGSQYLALQTNDDTVWTNLTGYSGSTVYVDTFLKFNECGDDAEDLDNGAKTALWMSGDSLYIKGLASDGTTNNYALAAPGGDSVYYPTNWYRLTVSTKVFDGALHFNVRVNGEEVSGMPDGIEGGTATNYFRSLLDDITTVDSVGFKGTGSLDNFGVATRYPMPDSYEHYFASGTGTVDDPFDATDDELKAYSDYGLTLVGKFFSVNGYIAEGTALVYSDGAYTVKDGAAALNDIWYATFAEAYDHASAKTDSLVVKIAGDFTPVFSDPSGNNTRTFASITFTTSNTTAENIAIATTDGKSVMKTSSWVFPENATLTLSASFELMSVEGGTLNVPSPIVVTMGAPAVFDDVAHLTGDGTINTSSDSSAFDEDLANANVKSLLQASMWEGTFRLKNQPVGAFNPNLYGNANSTVAFGSDLYTGAYFGSGADEPLVIQPAIRLETDLTIKNGYAKAIDKKDDALVTFTKLTGSGNMTTFATTSANKVYYAITTIENYTGTLVVSDKTDIQVGTVVLAAAPGDGCVVPVTLAGTKSAIGGALTYTVTGSEETGKLIYKAVDGGTDGLYVAATVDVTVTGGANTSQAWTIDGVDAGSTPPENLTEGQTYVVVFTANDNYSFPEGATTTFEGTVGTEDVTITAPNAVADGGEEDTPFENGDGTTFTIPASVTNNLHGVVADFSATAAGKGMTYAQAYALGLLNESTGEVSDLPAVLITVGPQEISGATVNAVALQLSGSLATRGGYTVTCKVYKSASLPIPAATEPEAVTLDPTGAAAWTQATGDATAGFYQVKVTVSNAAP